MIPAIEQEVWRQHGLRAIEKLRRVLERYTFAGANEAQVQQQVINAIDCAPENMRVVGSEVIDDVGRFDIVATVDVDHAVVRVVIELKVRGTSGAAERQAQRYAKASGVDAVVVATTSNRLTRDIAIGTQAAVHQMLGGKPFGVIYLRPF